ncbi:gasdermin Eb [Pristis pectinata]|uniref:gasdermin Eb n=1 Tax=Pristis pectinata TaxID=685728 RepID=UPI00223CA5BA|nr:gasdermin Eb [Pristis pectinata]XP_051871867.1 gasdermin Eb [Pristis pectinata]XP_051871868.1 gasdermin Eb [Pristis pectinata]XP_051871869.1 gasdermin Eb [Pristis pectinata]XP_051871871.1 gasdermin Eb [Pristis pectinata]XP_051871872.1 gasdermin Eb [Pristis pectinata]XP_051871873.1 gasdermin Eb [Pristis pectinata]XP_051871874.1 gasdermin Eb [Pristis pectinata]
MFAKATSSFVKQIESSGDLIPVSSLNDSDKLQLLSLVTKKKKGWFWQKPKYCPSSFTLQEILTSDALIKPAVTESAFLKYEGKFGDKMEASAETQFAHLSFSLEGQDAVELESSFGNLKKQELDLQQLLKIVEKSTINLNHPFVQQACEKRNEILCIVNEKVITSQKCSISEHTQIEEKCGGTMGLKTKILKVSVDDDGSVTKDADVVLEIPPRTVIAYSVTELLINQNGHFELCLLSDKCGGFDKVLLDRNKRACASTVCAPLSCVDGAHKSQQSALKMDIPSEASLIVLKPAIEEANQQFQPFLELSEENCQQLFRLYCEFLYHEETVSFLENALDELSAAEQPNLLGLQELDSAQAQKVKELLQILGYSCSNKEGSSTKVIKTPELLIATFYLFSALAGMSEESLAVLGICCETQILPTLHYLINNVSDDGMIPVDDPNLLPLREEDNFYIAHRLFTLSNVCLEVRESTIKVITDIQPGMAPVLLCIVLQGFAILSGIKRNMSNPNMQS